MIFSWLRRRRRAKLLAEPFPVEWLAVLDKNVPHYRRLEPDDQRRLREFVRLLIAEKNWEGCGGLALTDGIKVTIAALACLLVLRRDLDAYAALFSILVYPDSYMAAESEFPLRIPRDVGPREGESWSSGAVIVNWAELVKNLREQRGHNLVLHEFAHQLDYGDREANGVPLVDGYRQYAQWRQVIDAEYRQLVAAAEEGRPTVLDKYGTMNEAEFFAVATECFFERPRPLRDQHATLYQLLAEYYRQDPAGWRE